MYQTDYQSRTIHKMQKKWAKSLANVKTFCTLSGNKVIFCISSGLAPSRTSMRSSTRSTRTAATRSSSQSSSTGRLKRTSISKMTMTTFKLYLSTSTIVFCQKKKKIYKVEFKATLKWPPGVNHRA